MARILLWLCLFITYTSALPLPENRWRGDGLYWTENVNSKGLLRSLDEKGIRTLVMPGGSMGWKSKLGVYINPIRYGMSEKEWENRFSFRNLLEMSLDDELVRALSGHTSKTKEEFSQKLIHRLEKFGRRIDGVLLRANCSAALEENILDHVASDLRQREWSVGISLCSQKLHETSPFQPAPDFVVLRLEQSQWLHEKGLRSYASRLSSWNRPFYFHASMEPVLSKQGHPLSLAGSRKLMKSGALRLVREGNTTTGKKAELELTRSVSLEGFRFQKGTVFQLMEPGHQGLFRYFQLAASMAPYWYSGSFLDLDSWNPRILLKKHEVMEPPRVYYKIDPGERSVDLELSLENPNPIPSSRGDQGAGIVLEYSGYRLKGIQLGDFETIRAMGGKDGDRILLSLSALNSYSRARGLKLQLEGKGGEGALRVLGWFRPRASTSISYDSGSQSELLPEFAISKLGQPMWVQGAERTR